MVHIYHGILLSHKNEWNNAICSIMDGPIEFYTEGSKSDREGEISHYILYMWNLKRNDTNKLRKQSLIDLENKLMVAEGKGELGSLGKVGYMLLYSKQITNKDLLYSTGNSTQYYVAAWMRWGLGGERIKVYLWLSPLAVHLKLSQHC